MNKFETKTKIQTSKFERNVLTVVERGVYMEGSSRPGFRVEIKENEEHTALRVKKNEIIERPRFNG